MNPLSASPEPLSALIEPRVPLYQWGQRVVALDALRNDGSHPEHAPDAVLAEPGAVGEIVNIGHATVQNEPVYLVEFGRCVVGCFEEEIAPAPAQWWAEGEEAR